VTFTGPRGDGDYIASAEIGSEDGHYVEYSYVVDAEGDVVAVMESMKLEISIRAAAAGIDGFHPHRLRHTAAHRWLAAGGSESGLMSVAGWTRPDMLMRYTKAQAASRAAEEARRLNLGDL
jgi:integrase